MRLRESIRMLIARARELLRRRRIAEELDEGLRLHLELETEYNVARGMTESEARRQARLAFGGVQQFREATSETRGFVALDQVVRDVRFAVRRLRRTPAFTVGVVATLGVGFGWAVGL